MEDGFIKISRKLLDWEHGDNLALTGFWIRLLLRANWKDSRRLKSGELYLTYDGIAEELGISRTTVYRYLKILRESGEIETETNGRRTKVRIVAWNKYQKFQFETSGETSHETSDDTSGETSLSYLKEEREERKEIKKKRGTHPQFQKPTLEEVQAYITENLYTVDAQRFMDYYESNGWQIGKNHMKDWKATVRNWERRNQEQFKKEKQKGQGWSFDDL